MKIEGKQKKRAVAAASVFAIALGTGFVMQTLGAPGDGVTGGEGESVVVGSAGPVSEIQPLSAALQSRPPGVGALARQQDAPRQSLAEAIRVPDALADPAPVAEAPVTLAAREPAPPTAPAPAAGTVPPVAAGDDCALALTVSARPAAMAHLAFRAPCDPGARVTVRHGALRFTAMTDAEGALGVDLPALARNASFEARLDSGARALAVTLIEGVDGFERTALTWQAGAGVGLHAFENGADYGDPGHISAQMPASPARAAALRGGFLTRLGDPEQPGAWLAEVYSYPRAAGGTVDVTVEAEVTAANCGREMDAKVLLDSGAGYQAQPLTAAMPACDAVGELLVFSGLLPEMRFAAAQ